MCPTYITYLKHELVSQDSLSYYTMFGRDALGVLNSRENCCMIGSIASAPAVYSLLCLYSFQRLFNEGQL